MKKTLLVVAACLLVNQTVQADDSGISFWVFKKDTLQTILAKGNGLEDPAKGLSGKVECWGHFLGDSCDMCMAEESLQFRLRTKIEEDKMEWGLWLYRNGENRSGGGRGMVTITDGWIFPPNWEKLEWVVLFKKFKKK